MTKQDFLGIWYNEYYKLTISNDNVQLDTNIETQHKPFYTNCIFYEKNEFSKLDKDKIQISKSIILMITSEMSEKLTIIVTSDRITFIKLTKFI